MNSLVFAHAATVKFPMILSAPTGTDADTYGRDSWANGTQQDFSSRTGFERELLNLLGYLDASDVENLVFVVTDVHAALSIRYDGNVHFLAEIRDETGAVRPGSSIDLAPEGQ